jgi:hypothetical protein
MLDEPKGDPSAVDGWATARVLISPPSRTICLFLLASLGVISLLAITFGFSLLVNPRAGVGPAMVLISLGLLSGWTDWKLARTAREVAETADGIYAFTAMTRRWRVAPETIVAVKGDAYGLFLVVVTSNTKVWVRSRRESRRLFLREMARANPTIEFDQYANRLR